MASTTTFKIKKQMDDLDQLAEILKKHLNPKFKVSVTRAGSGMKQFITGNTTDALNIVKNAYHGVMLTLGPRDPQLDYQVIGAWRYIPNAALNQVSSHEGILDKVICNQIFSNGKDLYESLEEKIVSELDGKRVDRSFDCIEHSKPDPLSRRSGMPLPCLKGKMLIFSDLDYILYVCVKHTRF